MTGAGAAAIRIHRGLLAEGIKSRFCVAFPGRTEPETFTPGLPLPSRIARLAQLKIDGRLLAPYAAGYDYVLSTGYVGHDIRRIVEQEQPDIVQLHWIAGNSFKLSTLSHISLPIVWRLSDMWPFCGIEHLQPDPERYIHSPRNDFRALFKWDLPNRVMRAKQAIYSSLAHLTVVSPSRWLQAAARSSYLLGQRVIELIPTSCDTDLFSMKDRHACRNVLGLPPGKRIILVGATSLGTRWKGMDLFAEAMISVASAQRDQHLDDLHIVTFGKHFSKLPGLSERIAITSLGEIRDPRLMAILYGAADVFVAPSRMENLANTVLEAMASGTTVVAFNIGGMPDAIDHRENGFLANPFDTGELAQGIIWALGEWRNEKLRECARSKIIREFSIRQEIEKYIRLYQKNLCGVSNRAGEVLRA